MALGWGGGCLGAGRAKPETAHPPLDPLPGRHSTTTLQRQTFPRVLVHDRKPLQCPTVRRAVEDEIPRPHVVLVLRPKPHTATRARPQTPPFPLLLRHSQPLPPPHPVHPPAVHLPALPPQQRP